MSWKVRNEEMVASCRSTDKRWKMQFEILWFVPRLLSLNSCVTIYTWVTFIGLPAANHNHRWFFYHTRPFGLPCWLANQIWNLNVFKCCTRISIYLCIGLLTPRVLSFLTHNNTRRQDKIRNSGRNRQPWHTLAPIYMAETIFGFFFPYFFQDRVAFFQWFTHFIINRVCDIRRK